MTELPHIDAIRQRAYAIWEQAGRPHGQDREHWLQAEAEIAAKPARPLGRRPRAKPAGRPAAPKRARKAR